RRRRPTLEVVAAGGARREVADARAGVVDVAVEAGRALVLRGAVGAVGLVRLAHGAVAVTGGDAVEIAVTARLRRVAERGADAEGAGVLGDLDRGAARARRAAEIAVGAVGGAGEAEGTALDAHQRDRV